MHEDRIRQSGMIGRAEELKHLQLALEGVLEKHRCGVVTIVGEAGMGKSRLLGEFQKWLKGCHPQSNFLIGRATAEMGHRPLAFLRAVVCARFDIQESDPADIARQKFAQGISGVLSGRSSNEAQFTGLLLGFDFPVDAEARERFEHSQQNRPQALQILSRCLASLGSAALAFEDLHWADDDSLDVIAELCRAADAPLLILNLARPDFLERRTDWASGENHDLLELEPLSETESEALAVSISPEASQFEPNLRSLIVTRTAGNPLYIEEFVKMLADRRAGAPASHRAGNDTKIFVATQAPSTLGEVLRERLEGLSPPELGALEAASVIGQIFWDRAVESLTGRSVMEALESLCHKKLIRRRETSGFGGAVEYTFKHDLLRETAYGRVAKTPRQEFHARFAEWLTECSGMRLAEVAGLAAVHFELAGRADEAAEWHGRAAHQARLSHAHAGAAEYFRRALKLLAARHAPGSSGVDKELAWLEGLAVSLTQMGSFGEAEQSYRKLRERAASSGNLARQARAWNGLAYLHERRGENHASVEAAARGEEAARQAGSGSEGDWIEALHLQGWASYRMGDAARVMALGAQTLELCQQFGDRARRAASLKLFGVAHLQFGRYEEADRCFREGLALCREVGDLRNTGAMLSNLGESARLRGDCAAAVALYSKALEIARDMAERGSEMVYLSNLAGARLGLGQFQEAEAELREAISITGMPKSCVLSETYAFLARACLGQGKLGEAVEAARRAVKVGKDSEVLLDIAGGWRVLGEVLALCARGELGASAAPAGDAFPDDSALCFAESLRACEQLGARHEQARTLFAWSELDRQSGRIDAAEEKANAARGLLAHGA